MLSFNVPRRSANSGGCLKAGGGLRDGKRLSNGRDPCQFPAVTTQATADDTRSEETVVFDKHENLPVKNVRDDAFVGYGIVASVCFPGDETNQGCASQVGIEKCITSVRHASGSNGLFVT
jgi:hypothetical protein